MERILNHNLNKCRCDGMADMTDLESVASSVWVQVPPSTPKLWKQGVSTYGRSVIA